MKGIIFRERAEVKQEHQEEQLSVNRRAEKCFFFTGSCAIYLQYAVLVHMMYILMSLPLQHATACQLESPGCTETLTTAIQM